MTFFEQLYGIAGAFLLLAAGVMSLFRAEKRSRPMRAALMAGCLAVVLIPVNGLSPAGYFRGVVCELSITSMLLLGCVVLRQLLGKWIISRSDRASILRAAAVAGLILYPAWMGYIPVEVYRFGYQPVVLLLALLALAIVAWVSRRRAAALFPLIVVVAFDFQLLGSSNLWDYMIDPLVTIFAWGWAIHSLARLIAGRHSPNNH